MAFIRFRRPIILCLTIAILSLICLLFVAQEYNIDQNNVAVKVMSWIGLSPKKNSIKKSPLIFFVETSGKLNLEAREACAIESASLHHPYSNVTLYTIGAFAPTDVYVQVLRNISNIYIKHLNLSELFQKTPLATWHENGLIQESYYPIEHLSDAVRLAILWKFGGIYLDTDVIVIRSFQGVRNAVSLQQQEEANGAVLVFDKKFPFLTKCMKDYVQHFSAEEWANQGPALITRNLKSICRSEVLKYVINSPFLCEGVTLLTEESFYPIPWPEWEDLFESADVVDFNFSQSYTVHLWGKLSRQRATIPGNNSVLENLALNNCPAIFQIMSRNGRI